MISLDNAGTRALSLITAQNGASVTVNYSDYTIATGAYARGIPILTTITGATTTEICASPASGVIRDIDLVTIHNTYAGSHAMTLQVTSAVGGPFILETPTLAQGDSVKFTHGSGFDGRDSSNQTKFVMPGYLPLSGGTISGALTLSAALTYGGVTLTNAVTGTGNMVLATAPTFTTSINSGTTFTAFAGATTLLTIGGTGATSVVNIPGTKSGTTSTSAAVTINSLGVAENAFVGSTLNVTGITTLGGAIVGPATATVFNTVSTTINAFGAATTGLNIGGNASHIGIGTGGVGYSGTRHFHAFTSDGASTIALLEWFGGQFTGAAGDTAFLVGGSFSPTFIATQTASEAVGVVATARFAEPVITNNLTGGFAITKAATVFIVSAPTEGTTNAALWVDTGNVIVGGNTRLGGLTAPTVALDVTGAALISTTMTVTGGFGCNTKAAQTAYASGGALAAYGAGANGLDSGANMSALHALVVNMRAALVANGVMS